MIPDYFTGFTQAEVEATFAKLKAELPKVLAAYADGGSQVTKIARDQMRIDIAGCQKALKKFDPDTYGKRHRTMTSRVEGHLPR